MQRLHRLHRFEHAGIPIYVDSQVPDWFVPSSQTDNLLKAVYRQNSQSIRAKNFSPLPERLQYLLNSQEEPPPYQGRKHHLRLGEIKEIWFHLTDTCNLSCRHCLFASSPTQTETLHRQQLHSAIDQAAALGCRLFYFTGGEPFVYLDFCATLRYVLERHPACHAAVLTNGLLLQKYMEELTDLDCNRIHLQISMDGLEKEHDFLRGQDSYSRLCENLSAAAEAGPAFTISIAVNSGNADQLEEVARKAHALGATGLHFMYHFVRGKGTKQQFIPPDHLFKRIVKAAELCKEIGLKVDNLEALKSQVFTIPGSRFDLSNTGWESLAIGPDSKIYPSPALIRVEELACGSLDQGLEQVWRHSPVLQKIRAASLTDVTNWQERPLALLTGGGDSDHSWLNGQTLVGHDPYLALYEQLILHLIAEQAAQYPDQGLFRLRMGEVRHDCPDTDNGSDGSVGLTHCNCLLALADTDGHSSVREFYAAAARKANEEIINPFAPDATLDSFIPEESGRKLYGCGSPVQDAAPQVGETVVDLGSGSGVECFLAAAKVGRTGRVVGIDMTDDMLKLACASKEQVTAKLGYDNIAFRKGYLEAIPLEDACADAVISNCVINLSPDKRRTYLETFRILKPGGRLVVSDVISDEPITAAIKNNTKYRGECLGGAMQQDDLVVLLEDCGFENIFLHKRYPYREVDSNRFYSLTYEAQKENSITKEKQVRCVYRGPLPMLKTDAELRLERGRITRLPADVAASFGEQLFILDDAGVVVNLDQKPCGCAVAPEVLSNPNHAENQQNPQQSIQVQRHRSGCMVCGNELACTTEPVRKKCHFCGSEEQVNTACIKGHFICDSCHQQEGIEIVRHICLNSRKKDMIALLNAIRSHPAVPMHGPEHHSMVPGVILAAYRNNGGDISRKIIAAGIKRGSRVPGGTCGFWGTCGAVIGAGIAVSLLLEATPLTAYPRHRALTFVAKVLTRIAETEGGRCCQRESWLALKETARLSEEFFKVAIPADAVLQCSQYRENRECIRQQCPLWDMREREKGLSLVN